jgi:hypothetical protein
MLLSALQMIITKMALAQYIFSATNQGTQPAIIGAFFPSSYISNVLLFFELSLCLSRACLGKIIVFMYTWRKRTAHIAVFACNAIFCGAKNDQFYQDRLGTDTGKAEGKGCFLQAARR